MALQANSGLYCAQAGPVADNQTSRLQLISKCGAGKATFSLKVSSELGWGKLTVGIDGILQGQWSDDVDWTQKVVPVTAGPHTFDWTYEKDGSSSQGADTARIDDITLPARTP